MKKKYISSLLAVIIIAACGTKEPAVVEPAVADAPQVIPEERIKPLIDMVTVPSGAFPMGSPKGTSNSLDIERPVHQVEVKEFLLGKYEVTQGQYFEVTGTRPGNFLTNAENDSPDGWMLLPIEMVNWYEALIFCNRLSIKEKLNPVYRISGSVNPDDWGDAPLNKNAVWDAVDMTAGANGYRLPTEAEWEFAARGGDSAPKTTVYSGSNSADSVSWYYDNSKFKIHEIGKKAPNQLDLYDMSGNAMEWCWDWLGNYTADTQSSPTGPLAGQFRIIRGGGWSVSVHYSRIAYRHYNNPYYRGVNLGFRVARSL